MPAFMTASMTIAYKGFEIAAVNIINLPRKPTVGGMPAIPKAAIASSRARMGERLYNPLRLIRPFEKLN